MAACSFPWFTKKTPVLAVTWLGREVEELAVQRLNNGTAFGKVGTKLTEQGENVALKFVIDLVLGGLKRLVAVLFLERRVSVRAVLRRNGCDKPVWGGTSMLPERPKSRHHFHQPRC
jgi:hypothetical protein